MTGPSTTPNPTLEQKPTLKQTPRPMPRPLADGRLPPANHRGTGPVTSFLGNIITGFSETISKLGTIDFLNRFDIDDKRVATILTQESEVVLAQNGTHMGLLEKVAKLESLKEIFSEIDYLRSEFRAKITSEASLRTLVSKPLEEKVYRQVLSGRIYDGIKLNDTIKEMIKKREKLSKEETEELRKAIKNFFEREDSPYKKIIDEVVNKYRELEEIWKKFDTYEKANPEAAESIKLGMGETIKIGEQLLSLDEVLNELQKLQKQIINQITEIGIEVEPSGVVFNTNGRRANNITFQTIQKQSNESALRSVIKIEEHLTASDNNNIRSKQDEVEKLRQAYIKADPKFKEHMETPYAKAYYENPRGHKADREVAITLSSPWNKDTSIKLFIPKDFLSSKDSFKIIQLAEKLKETKSEKEANDVMVKIVTEAIRMKIFTYSYVKGLTNLKFREFSTDISGCTFESCNLSETNFHKDVMALGVTTINCNIIEGRLQGYWAGFRPINNHIYGGNITGALRGCVLKDPVTGKFNIPHFHRAPYKWNKQTDTENPYTYAKGFLEYLDATVKAGFKAPILLFKKVIGGRRYCDLCGSNFSSLDPNTKCDLAEFIEMNRGNPSLLRKVFQGVLFDDKTNWGSEEAKKIMMSISRPINKSIWKDSYKYLVENQTSISTETQICCDQNGQNIALVEKLSGFRNIYAITEPNGREGVIAGIYIRGKDGQFKQIGTPYDFNNLSDYHFVMGLLRANKFLRYSDGQLEGGYFMDDDERPERYIKSIFDKYKIPRSTKYSVAKARDKQEEEAGKDSKTGEKK